MNLDPRTLLFSLILTYALTVLSLVVAAAGTNGKRDGMGKWAAAMLLETVTWVLVASRGVVPDEFSIVLANVLKAGAHGFILAAIFEFQRRPLPRWQYLVPVALTLVMATVLVSDIKGRFIWGGLIFGFQMVLIARALLTDAETRAGRAWRLLFGGVCLILFVLGMRALVALFGHAELAQPQNLTSPHPVQILSFVAIMGTALLGSIGFVLMIKERADREILHLAMTDSLTQVPNRRALMQYAERALARRNGSPLALLMIDVDHFKRINDTCGHLAGDAVLKKVAARLNGRLRGDDLMGRYGGEEFCIIAQDTGREGALRLAESLREIVAGTPFVTEWGELKISVSIGVSCCAPQAHPELKQMLAEADASLYAAKQAGRDRVNIFSVQAAIATRPCGDRSDRKTA